MRVSSFSKHGREFIHTKKKCTLTRDPSTKKEFK